VEQCLLLCSFVLVCLDVTVALEDPVSYIFGQFEHDGLDCEVGD